MCKDLSLQYHLHVYKHVCLSCWQLKLLKKKKKFYSSLKYLGIWHWFRQIYLEKSQYQQFWPLSILVSVCPLSILVPIGPLSILVPVGPLIILVPVSL